MLIDDMASRTIAATATRRRAHVCRHCEGSAREPEPMALIEFSRAGERRGELQRLSDETGIDKSQLSEIFRGIRTPSVASIVLIARALDVSESRLIKYPPIWARICSELGDDSQ